MKSLTIAAYVAFLTIACLFVNTPSFAQSVLDPNDPVITYNPAAPPTMPPGGTIGKWVRTKRLNNWNTDSYKAYFYNGFAFRLKFPKTYDPNANDGKKYPMIIFFHGRGEGGSVYDNEYSLLHGGQQFRDKVDNGTFDGYILIMQTTNGFWGTPPYNAIRGIIDYMAINNKLDIFRIVDNGLSSGGSGTWEMMIENPTYIAAALPMSASSTIYQQSSVVQPLKFTPIWIFQGGLDPAPTPYTTEGVRDAFLSAGGTFKYTLYPQLAHGVWNTVWAEPDFYPFVNRAHKANPWPLFGRTEFCPGDAINVTIGLTPGFSQYEWRKNGELISGATSNTLQITGTAVAGNSALGVYSARVRRGSIWSDWSPIPVEIKIKAPTVSPNITIQGLRSNVIPALDGNTSVPLQVPTGYQSYVWQQEGSGTTISTTNTLNAASPGSYKVRVTEAFGCSSSFSPLFTVVNANGPNKPDAPINLIATTLSKTEIRLDWSDNPSPQNNETAFEVYMATSSSGPYTLISITGADVLTYTVSNLEAAKKYFFKLRAVNLTAASDASNVANATTESDTKAPTAPTNLTVTGTTRNSISLNWQASTDDVAVLQYDVYINGKKSYVTESTNFTVFNLQTAQSYNITVRARDAAGNTSPNSNQVTAQALFSGLTYKYYTYTGTWNSLPNFTTLTPVSTGTMPNVAITPRTQNDNFAFLWEGFITIPVSGTYYFRTRSDDGSRLWLGPLNGTESPYVFGANSSLVNNDGLHGAQDRTSAAQNLQAGTYPIAIAFYEGGGGESMSVTWRTPQTGTNYVAIPNSAFADPASPADPVNTPGNLVATAVSYKQINLNWTDNSNNESGFEIYRSTNETTGFVPIGTAPANSTSYVDSASLSAATRYYYRIRAIGQTGESGIISNVNNPEAVWKFNNAYTDASGNNRTLSQSNNPVFDASDKREGTHAIRFNGSNQFATIPANSSFLQNVYNEKTVAFWMKSNNNTGNRILFDIGGSDDGLAIRLNNSELIAGIARNNTRNSISTPYTSTGWNHVALVYSGTTLRLYVNGVEAASNTSLSNTAMTTTSNGSRIGYVNGSNAFNSSSGYFNGWIDDFNIYTSALSVNDIANLMNNIPVSQSFATTAELPALPGAPANLAASGISRTKIQVTWDDVNDESGYQLFRSNSNNGNYVLFATLPANTVSFIDSGLFANTINYYKVRAFNEGGNTVFSNEDSAKTANSIPVVTPVATQFMRFGTTLQVNITATDEDPEEITVTTDNLPAFASYTSTGNGTGYISFVNPASQGHYPGIIVTATDPQGGSSSISFDLTINDNYLPIISGANNISVDEQQSASINLSASDENATDVLTWTFTGLPSFATPVINGNNVQISFNPGYADNGTYEITASVNDGNSGTAAAMFVLTVNDVNPNRKVYINFNDGSSPAAAPWNNTNKATPSLNDNFGNLADETGTNSNIGLQITSSWQNLGNATNTFGAVTGNNTGVYPDNVMRTCYFTTNVNQTIRIYGLNSSYKYNFTFFGSRGSVNDDRTTIYTINGNSVSLNAANNTQNTVTLSNLQPATDGTLILTLQKGPSSAYGYLNAMVIESIYDDGNVPAKPRNLTGTASATNIQLNWVDAAFNETAYRVYRSTNRTGSYTALNPSAVNPDATAYADAAVVGSTTYYYYVVAINGVGASSPSDTIAVNMPNGAPLLAPIADVSMKTTQSVNVNIAATDSPEDVITISVSNLPAFATFTSTGNGTGTIAITPGTAIGSFSGITVTATDNNGASTSRQFTIAVSDINLNSYFVNFNQVLPVGSPWNSFNSAPNANTTITGIRDEAGVVSGINVTLVDGWDGANDVGATTGNNSGVYPDNVMRTAYFTAATTPKRIRISGLTAPNTKYNLVFFASRGAVNDNRNTVYSYGGQSVTLNAANNTTNVVQLQGLVPNASGVIEFTATRGSGSSFGYINAMSIQSYVDDGIPLAPTSLVVAPRSGSSLQLTWSDRSSNEAGFEIYKSTQPDGGFTLLHTTGSNASSYQDNGLSAGIVYYYKVRARTPENVYSDYSNVAGASTIQYSVAVNFNQVDPAAAPWNNTNEGPIEGDRYQLKNNLNNPTGISMVVVGNAFNGVNPFGMNTGNNSGVYPDNVIRSTWWLDANTTAMLRIDGLNITNKYNFTFFASRDGGGSSPDRTTVYSIGDRSVSLNAVNNIYNTVTITNVSPDANGSVLISIRAGGLSPFAYIGGMMIEAYEAGDITGNFGGPSSRKVDFNAPAIVFGNAGQASQNVTQPISRQNPVNNEVAKDMDVQIYPNPVTSTDPLIAFSLPGKTERLNISVIDVNGKTILIKELRNLPSGNSRERLGLNVDKLLPGIYLLRVEDVNNRTVKTIRFIKAR